jgi:predicted nucleic acid-binding protein
MIYLDSTFFVIASLDSGEQGNTSRECLELLNRRNDKAGLTSFLTVDETVYVVKKHTNQELGLKAGEGVLATNILFGDVTREIIVQALHIMRHEGLNPRDAIHAATMKTQGAKEIVSEDADFDRVPWIKRISTSDFLRRLSKGNA